MRLSCGDGDSALQTDVDTTIGSQPEANLVATAINLADSTALLDTIANSKAITLPAVPENDGVLWNSNVAMGLLVQPEGVYPEHSEWRFFQAAEL